MNSPILCRPKHAGFSLISILIGVGVLIIAFIALGSHGKQPQRAVTQPTPFSGVNPNGLWITANLPPPAGMGLSEMQAFLDKNGADFMVQAANWDVIEPAPNHYALTEVTGPLTLILPKTSFKGAVLSIRMIDSNVRTMPADLASKPFDDPTVKERFLAMLHALAQAPGVARYAKYVLLGNEVDGYLGSHPSEVAGFTTLLKAAVDQLHTDLPGVRVGTITTFETLKKPELFKSLTASSDFIDYTYYPLGANWHQRPSSDVPGDFAKMVAGADGKLFGFTEIGYSASPDIGSSDAMQLDFMKAVFKEVEAHKSQVAFINWASLGDSSDDTCRTYAFAQHLPSVSTFCGYAAHTGLFTYDNTPRPAWDFLVGQMKSAR